MGSGLIRVAADELPAAFAAAAEAAAAAAAELGIMVGLRRGVMDCIELSKSMSGTW